MAQNKYSHYVFIKEKTKIKYINKKNNTNSNKQK